MDADARHGGVLMKRKPTKESRRTDLSAEVMRGIDRAFNRANAKLDRLVARSKTRPSPRQQLLAAVATGKAALEELDRLLAVRGAR
jgi:hypothetical protein